MLPIPTTIDQHELVKMAKKKAGGLRKLCKAAGVARTTICDHSKRRTYSLQKRTVAKLVKYLEQPDGE